MNIYVKSMNESQTTALDSLSERIGQTNVIQYASVQLVCNGWGVGGS